MSRKQKQGSKKTETTVVSVPSASTPPTEVHPVHNGTDHGTHRAYGCQQCIVRRDPTPEKLAKEIEAEFEALEDHMSEAEMDVKHLYRFFDRSIKDDDLKEKWRELSDKLDDGLETMSDVLIMDFTSTIIAKFETLADRVRDLEEELEARKRGGE